MDIPNFKTYDTNRQGRGGGEVAIFVREELSSVLRNFNVQSVNGV